MGLGLLSDVDAGALARGQFADHDQERTIPPLFAIEGVALQNLLQRLDVVARALAVPGDERVEALRVEPNELRVQDALADAEVGRDRDLVGTKVDRIDLVAERIPLHVSAVLDHFDAAGELVEDETELVLVHVVHPVRPEDPETDQRNDDGHTKTDTDFRPVDVHALPLCGLRQTS